MSQDVIGGIAVMQTTKFPGVWRIYLQLQHADGSRGVSDLCFSEGNSEPAGISTLVGEPIWQFRRSIPRHGWLDCNPSIKISTSEREIFHNAGNWVVQYVEMRYPEEQPPLTKMPRYHVAESLNDPKISEQERASRFEYLRQSGVIY